MKKLGLALALTLMGATAASADPTIQFRLGGDRPGVVVRDHDRDWDRRHYIRRDVVTTGSVCETKIIYSRNSRGDRVKRTIRECDD